MSNIIFLMENDNIYEKLSDEQIDIGKMKEQIKVISNKIRNNKIGYFQFKIDKEIVKICIIPKVLDKDDSSIESKYLSYIDRYFKILSKYNKKNTMLKNNIHNYTNVQIANAVTNMCTLNMVLEYKYALALNEIEKSLRKYIRIINEKEEYSNITIKHKIDIRKNIVSIDKTKIHQTMNKKNNKSRIAEISIFILNDFIKNKVPSIEDSSKIYSKALHIKKLIKKKFKISPSKFTIEEVTHCKVAKEFEKLKGLYKNLLILLDIDDYFKGTNSYLKYDTIRNFSCITFNPEEVFEYFVFDKYKSKGVENILFNKLHKKEYDFKKEEILFYKVPDIEEEDLDTNEIVHHKVYTFNKEVRLSTPDLIFEDEIKDCKWKVLNSKIDYQDYIKLKNDCKIRGKNKASLVYPLILTNQYKGKELSVEDSEFEEGIFHLKIEECRIDS